MKPHTIFSLLLIAGVTSGAYAAGNHAGGHDHGPAAIGVPGEAGAVTRTIRISMSDTMRYSPSSINVKSGETVKLVVKNNGKLKHELVLGTAKELREHAELMKKNPHMEHDDPNQVTVAPGKTANLVWKFTQAGKVDFACLEPGHFEAGMVGKVRVSGKAVAAKSGLIPVANHAAPAATPANDHAAQTQAAPAAKSANAVNEEWVEAEVKKIDKDAKKITLKHGEIKKFGMPPMAMVFQVKDPAMLDQVKVGDKIMFSADYVNNAYLVTSIEMPKK